MASPNRLLGSPEEVALNQAILASLRQTTAIQPNLPAPIWNNQTQFIPYQTTTTYIPVPQNQPRVPVIPQNTTVRVPIIPQPVGSPIMTNTRPLVPTIPQPVRSPIVPIMTNTRPLVQPVRSPIVPIMTNPVPVPPLLQTGARVPIVPITNQQLPPIPRTQIPIIPPLVTTTTTRPPLFNLPVSPRTTFQPLQTVQLSPRVQMSPRSPGKMTPEEEDQMRIAIMASLQETQIPITEAPVIIRTPPRSPLMTPPEIYDDDDDNTEDILMQEAIAASIEAAEQARLATFHANQIVASPASPRALSPNTARLLEDRAVREQQDREYEEAVRLDLEKAENARRAVEAATRAAAAAEEATRKLQEAKIADEARREALQPPILKFPLEVADMKDIYLLRFKLPSGSTVNHSFHRDEPFSSLLQQIRFDLKHVGNLTFSIQETQQTRSNITCDPTTALSGCGISNRTVVFVEYA